jgi:hypothetical protein
MKFEGIRTIQIPIQGSDNKPIILKLLRTGECGWH